MGFTDKINFDMSNIKNSVKNGAYNCKLEAQIAEQQMKIKSMTKEIGNLVLLELDDGEEMSPEIMERYTAIIEAREKICELKGQKKITKVVCPTCGQKTSADMNYCGKCGASMKTMV